MRDIDQLPDVAHERVAPLPLCRAGMENVDLVVNFGGQRIAAQGSLFVNLIHPDARGIHMSRLYLEATNSLGLNEVSLALLASLTKKMLETHEGLSNEAYVSISFPLTLEQRALLSENQGFRIYPLKVERYHSLADQGTNVYFTVTYSSTCPCSDALSRQLRAAEFLQTFPQAQVAGADVAQWLQSKSVATAHGQRSVAEVKLQVAEYFDLASVPGLIRQVEAVLGTPVQGPVKRVDEQEFARLNADNLMFAEDAVRRLAGFLRGHGMHGTVKVKHLESLHAHDAVAEVQW